MCALRYVVEKDKIADNIQIIKQRVGSGRTYAVLKANGYGLGCGEMAQLCAEHGLKHFAVTEIKDAEAVMASGAEVEELLFLSSVAPADISYLAELGVTFTVASELDARNLEPFHVSAHIKVDTGMGRRGLDYSQASQIAEWYTRYSGIHFTGIYTHFANPADSGKTNLQFSRFQSVLQYLQHENIDVGIRHCCGSSSLFLYDEMLLDGVRVGSALLGRVIGGEKFGLRRTGVCYAPLEAVRTLQKGATISYGSTFRAKKQMTVAVCPVGTHHGFGLTIQSGRQSLRAEIMEFLRRIRNRLSGSGIPSAIICGTRCQALGCVCSEMVVLDVTGVPCQAGDIAQLNINPMLLHDVPVEFIEENRNVEK